MNERQEPEKLNYTVLFNIIISGLLLIGLAFLIAELMT